MAHSFRVSTLLRFTFSTSSRHARLRSDFRPSSLVRPRHTRPLSSSNYGFDPLAEATNSGEGLPATMINAFNRNGFVVNDIPIEGTLLATQFTSFLFRIPALDQLTPESLEGLLLLKTRPELLVIGCGPTADQPPAPVTQWLARNSIGVECLGTRHACSTFNFMVQESRNVAAIMFPIKGAY